MFDNGEFVVTPEVKDVKRNRNPPNPSGLLSLPSGRTTSTKPILAKNSQLVRTAEPVCQPCMSAPALDDGGDILGLLGVSSEDSSVR